MALGVVAPLLGGTPRLVSAPSPAAAAFMAVLAADLLRGGTPPASIPAIFAAVILVAGATQLAVGPLRAGRLVKFMPYPVIAGYLTGAGLLILFLQLPKLVGAPPGATLWDALRAPSRWSGVALAVSAATLAVTLLAPPPPDPADPGDARGLAAGLVVYRLAAIGRPELLDVRAAGRLVVGPMVADGGGVMAGVAAARDGLSRVLGVGLAELRLAIVPGLLLAVLVSIDTLKTCLLVDVLTHSRHDSDRELVAVSIVLFVRERARAPLVRRIALGDALLSKHRRGPREREVLARLGGETVIAEVQGSLFFGSADRLYRTLEPHLGRCRRVVLDLSRVGSVDITAATMLRQIAARLGERASPSPTSRAAAPAGSSGSTSPASACLGLPRRSPRRRRTSTRSAARGSRGRRAPTRSSSCSSSPASPRCSPPGSASPTSIGARCESSDRAGIRAPRGAAAPAGRRFVARSVAA